MNEKLERIWNDPIIWPSNIVWWNREHGYYKGDGLYASRGKIVEFSRAHIKRQQRRIRRTQRKR